MEKKTYTHPTIEVLATTPENFVCLSIPIGQGAGPGGGGQAKPGIFFEDDDDNDLWEKEED